MRSWREPLTLGVAWSVLFVTAAAGGETETKANPSATTVASYYFPNYHPNDPRNEKYHGRGWSEWELVKAAKPRFPGHRQPKVPLWGYEDESDPAVMAKKIDAAADHGIDAFIFDWYYYEDGLFLERCLERGYLKAPNNRRVKFSLMWANHDWTDIFPSKLDTPPRLLYPGKVTPAGFEKMTDYIIETYFKHPSHWKIDGAPYFSIYHLTTLVKGLGGMEATKQALHRFREKTKAAGFPDLHLNAIVWGVQILPGDAAVKNPAEMVDYLGFSSITSYVWLHHVHMTEFPRTPYRQVMNKYLDYCRKVEKEFDIPYYPNVTMGWDASPRTDPSGPFVNRGYPFTPVMIGNTPEAFKEALVKVRNLVDEQPADRRIVTINCWNEWTEGSYLEPDTVHGMAYLDAVQEVFGQAAAK